jgi:hypothetical protein
MDETIVLQLQQGDNTESWHRKGVQLFQDKNYKSAEMCFQRAGDVEEERLCRAHIWRQVGCCVWVAVCYSSMKNPRLCPILPVIPEATTVDGWNGAWTWYQRCNVWLEPGA